MSSPYFYLLSYIILTLKNKAKYSLFVIISDVELNFIYGKKKEV